MIKPQVGELEVPISSHLHLSLNQKFQGTAANSSIDVDLIHPKTHYCTGVQAFQVAPANPSRIRLHTDQLNAPQRAFAHFAHLQSDWTFFFEHSLTTTAYYQDHTTLPKQSSFVFDRYPNIHERIPSSIFPCEASVPEIAATLPAMAKVDDFNDRQNQIDAENEPYHQYQYQTEENESWAGALPVKQ